MLSSADKMNDFQRVAFVEPRRSVNFARDDAAVQLDDDAPGTNLEIIEQTTDREAVLDLTPFAVNLDFHIFSSNPAVAGKQRELDFRCVANKKPRSRRQPVVTREHG